MKHLLLIALTLSSAYARVGQSAKYDLSLSGSKGSLTYKVTAQDQAEFKVDQNITIGGQSENSSTTVKKENIMTQERAKMILFYCGQLGGQLEQIGKHKACKAKANNVQLQDVVSYIQAEYNINPEYIWIGAVPIFGIVKFTGENKLTAVIKTYNW